MDALTKIRKSKTKERNDEFRIRFDLVSKSNLQDKQIFLSCSYCGISFRFYSGYRTPAENFEKKRERLTGGVIYVCRAKKNTFNKDGVPAAEINRRLEKLKLAAIKVFDENFRNRLNEFNKDNFIELLELELGEKKINEENNIDKPQKPISQHSIVSDDENLSNLNLINIENTVINDSKNVIICKSLDTENKKYLYLDYIKDDLSDIRSIFYWYHRYAQIMKVSHGRRKIYYTDIKRLKIYSQSLDSPLTLGNIDLKDFYNYLGKGEDKCLNTKVAIMKRLRAFFRHCRLTTKIINSNPFDDCVFADEFGTEIYDDPVCMTKDELTRLYNYDFSKNRLFELIRDMFCLQASLGCRIGDFMRFNYDNIDNGILSYFAHKTRTKKPKIINVPLSKRAKEIIEKYKNPEIRKKYKVKKDHLILPFVNSGEYNETLKDVFKEAKLMRNVVVYNRDEDKEEIFELWELASSHLARKTFIDILFQSGVPLSVIASMSGHSENSEALERYKTEPKQLKQEAVIAYMD